MRKFTNSIRLMMVLVLSLAMVVGFAQRTKPTGNTAPKQAEKVSIDQVVVNQGAQQVAKTATPVLKSGPMKSDYQQAPTETVLWSQMVPSTADGLCASQDFETGYDAYDCRGADDFTVTGGPWTVGVVKFLGGYWNGAGPAAGINIEFFNNAAGLPGTSIVSFLNLPYTSVASGALFEYTVSIPAQVFANGSYWIAIQGRMDFAVGGQFGISPQVAPQIALERHWINPGGGFGAYTTWTPGTTVWPTQVGRDWCFQLETPATCPAPTALFTDNITPTSARANWTAGGSETSWKIEYGPAGFTPGTGTLVTVATPFYTMPGLALGYYSWYVRAVCGVGDESGNSGPVNFTTYPPPVNDECGAVTPTTLTFGVPATFVGNNNGATVSCPAGPFNGVPGEVWEAFTITGQATVVLDYCGSGGGTPWGNAWLNLMTSCPCGPTSAGATFDVTTCPDGNVTMTWVGLAAGTYWYPVMLDPAYNSAGAYTIHVVATAFTPSGCQNTSQYPSGTINVGTGSIVTISTCSYAGEYSILTGFQIGETYEFTMSDLGTGTFITITDGPPTTANVLAYGVSPISWTATSTSDLYAHWNLNSACGTDAACHTTTVQCTSCAPCEVPCPGGSLQENEPDIADEGADVTNGGCNSAPPVFQTINIGDTYCGKVNTYTIGGGSSRDTDWYLLDLSASTLFWDLTWTVTAEFDLLTFIIDATTGDCSNTPILVQGGPAGACVTTAITALGLAPGIYYMWVGPSVFTGFPASTGPHEYVATLTGVSHPAPLATINPTTFEQSLNPGVNATDNLSIGNAAGSLPLTYTATIQNYADATYNAYPANANYNTGTCSTAAYTLTSVMDGKGTDCGFGKFSLAGIPPTATILSVTFNGYLTANSWPYWSITSLPYDPLVTPAATINAHIAANYGSATAYSYNTESGTLANGWLSRSLGGTAVADLQAALALGYFSIGIVDFDFTATYFVTFDGWAEANKPYLTIEYSTTPLWLTLNGGQVASGTVAGGAADNISVGYNTAGLAVGTYTSEIKIVTNEPGAKKQYLLPVTLKVGYAVSGNVYYGVTGTTKPMQTNTTVTLTPGATVPTGAAGAYTIRGNANGNYKLSGATTKPWGGLQAFDATLIARYLGSIVTFTNLQKRAADVNLSNTITAFDGTLVKRRLGSILVPQWTAPDFVFDGPFPITPVLDGLPVTISGADITQELRTLCTGDLNSSYAPAAE